MRDPSSNLIAFVLPILMLFIFGYGINLDSASIKIGLVMEDTSREARLFEASMEGTPYITVVHASGIEQVQQELKDGLIRGFVIVPVDFSKQIARPNATAPIQVVTDGAEPEIAAFVDNYARGAWANWQSQYARDQGVVPAPAINLEIRAWFNPSVQSRNYLIPGSITLIMTVVGVLLTSLVVAREWERGTMEALLASPVTRAELLLSKLIPYYLLGMTSMLICVLFATLVMGVPYRGGIFSLFLVSSLFLLTALGLGLFLSTVMRVQFNAAQASLNLAFLPSLMFSGFLYEINSMPTPIRALTYLFSARYFVTCLQTLFLCGDLWPILLRNCAELALFATVLITLTARATRRHLD